MILLAIFKENGNEFENTLNMADWTDIWNTAKICISTRWKDQKTLNKQIKPSNNKKGIFKLKRKGTLQVPNIKKKFKLGTDVVGI